MRPNPLKEKTFILSEKIVSTVQFLTKEKKELIFSKQLARSGTNPGAMVREAENAESRKDFIHKLGIAQKEIGETQYWLELLHHTGFLNLEQFKGIYPLTVEIMKLIRSSILTAKKNANLPTPKKDSPK